MLRQAEAEAVTATAVATATVIANATATARTPDFYNWILIGILRGMLPDMLIHIACLSGCGSLFARGVQQKSATCVKLVRYCHVYDGAFPRLLVELSQSQAQGTRTGNWQPVVIIIIITIIIRLMACCVLLGAA